MSSHNYDKQNIPVAKVLLWMTVFLVLYLPLILLMVASISGCVAGVILTIKLIISKVLYQGLLLGAATCAIGLFLVYPFSKALLRPFYALYKADADRGLEVTEEEAPELTRFVHKIADLTNNEHPKHIYISQAANARVFFDTRFSNIFFHVQKNIEIGLGIFRHMSLAETASCIAHEFGHFSQDKMRWGTVIYILNTLITNMMSVNDQWCAIVNYLLNFPWIIGQGIVLSVLCKTVGALLYGLTCGYTYTMKAIHKKIQLAYLDLSRKMEYEADDASARIVGSEVFVSFEYKLEEVANRQNIFEEMAQRMASQNILVKDYWDAYAKTDRYLAALTGTEFSSDSLLTKPVSVSISSSYNAQLSFEYVYSTHPDEVSRIAAVKAANYPKAVTFAGKAWEIVPLSIREKIAHQFSANMRKLCDPARPVRIVTDEELDSIIDKDNCWRQYALYFQRDIIEFDYEACKPSEAFSPNDTENLAIISRYLAAKDDYENALNIMKNHDIRHVIYKGGALQIQEDSH